jgi:fatty acid desaturase
MNKYHLTDYRHRLLDRQRQRDDARAGWLLALILAALFALAFLDGYPDPAPNTTQEVAR